MVLQHISRSQKHMASQQKEATDRDVDALRRDLDDAEATSAQLRCRIEALETIVTSDGFDLDAQARAAGLDLDALGTAEGRSRTRVR